MVNQFDKTLLGVQSKDMQRLLTDLRLYPQVQSCFAFGDIHHVTLNNVDWSKDDLTKYLTEKAHEDIIINPIKAGIEDCFMDLGVSNPSQTN